MFRGLRGAFSRFSAADGLFLSAGLAFFFLICLIPLLFIGVSMLGFVLSNETAVDAVIGQLARNFPVYRGDLTRALRRIVETRRVSGAVGTLILVVFATPLFSAARLIIHRMLGVQARVGFVWRFVADAGTVLLLGVLFFAATVVTWVYQWFLTLLQDAPWMSRGWLHASSVALSIVLSMALFYLSYRYLPRQRIRVGAALAGAVLAAVLWEIAKQLFRVYIREFGVYDQIYGPLGILIAFVMFVYYSAVVFVFGAAYAAALDARRRR